MANVGRGSDELIEACEKYVIKHRKSLDEKDITLAKRGFRGLNKGSDVLFQVLGDPHTQDLPKLN